jgi:hypothetical protein
MAINVMLRLLAYQFLITLVHIDMDSFKNIFLFNALKTSLLSKLTIVDAHNINSICLYLKSKVQNTA